MTDIYMDWDEPGAGTLFRGDDVLHIALDVDWSDTDHPIIPPGAHDFLNELLAMPARIATLEAAIVRHEKWDRHLNSDELPFYQPLPHHTELWAEVLAKETDG